MTNNLSDFQTILWPATKVSNVGFYKKASAGFTSGQVIEAPFTRSGAGRKVIDASGNLVDAAANVPAWTFPIGGSSAGCPYLTFLPSVENLVTYSEQFDNADWSKVDSTISANASASPDGTANADKLESDATASQAVIVRQSATVTATTDYTFSIFAKADEAEFVQIFFGSGQVTGNPRANFDLINGVKGTIDAGITSSIITLVNGFYCISVTVESAGTTLQPHINLIKTSSDARAAANSWTLGDGAFIWGAQLKEGSYISPLDYVKTEASAVTRSVDQITTFNPVSNGLITDAESYTAMFSIDASKVDDASVRFLIQYRNGGSSVWSFITRTTDNNITIRDNVNAVFVETSGETFTGLNRFVIVASSSSISVYKNGFSIYTASGDFSVDEITSISAVGETSPNIKNWNHAPTALTANQAEAASSWPSFDLMVSDLGYS